MPTYAIVYFILVLIILFFCAYHTYKHFISVSVLTTPEYEKLKKLNRSLLPSGFQYSPEGDYFYATLDCWQRKCGYCRLYDQSMSSTSIVVDREPICFEYKDRRFLVLFRKGQYGMSAGAEVSIYAADTKDLHIPGVFDGPFYESISDSELLPVSLHLYYKNVLIAKRSGSHWWLTIYKLGYYCNPSFLSAKISITFPDKAMSLAYRDGLLNAGYLSSDIHSTSSTVTLNFSDPKTPQPFERNTFLTRFHLHNNRMWCKEYQHLTKSCTDTVDKLEALSSLNPPLYHLALRLGSFKKMREDYLLIAPYAARLAEPEVSDESTESIIKKESYHVN